MKFKPLLCGLFALIGFTREATSATVLGSISGNDGIITVQPSTETDMSALFAIGNLPFDCFVVGACPDLALLQNISASSIGTSFTLDSSFSNFSAVVAALVSGDMLFAGAVPGPSYGTSSGGAVGFPLPDVSGDFISSLVLSIDNVVIQPNQVIGGTEFDLFFTLNIEGGTVPEPSTWLTMLAGCCLLSVVKGGRVLRKDRSLVSQKPT